MLIVAGLYLVIWGKKHDQVSSESDHKDQEASSTANEMRVTNNDLIVGDPERKISDETV